MEKNLTPFERALTDAVLDDFADVPASDRAVEIAPSQAFSHRMARRVRLEALRPVLNRRTLRLLLIAAVLTAFIFCNTAAPPRPIVQTPYTLYSFDEYCRFYFNRTQNASTIEEIKTVYEPTYIPHGYKLREEKHGTSWAFVRREWENAAGDVISYAQFPIGDRPCADVYLFATYDVMRRIEINGCEIWRSHDKDWIFYFWTDDAYYYMLSVYDTLSEETAERILASIRENPNAEIWHP